MDSPLKYEPRANQILKGADQDANIEDEFGLFFRCQSAMLGPRLRTTGQQFGLVTDAPISKCCQCTISEGDARALDDPVPSPSPYPWVVPIVISPYCSGLSDILVESDTDQEVVWPLHCALVVRRVEWIL
jgi:hypothetical protein